MKIFSIDEIRDTTCTFSDPNENPFLYTDKPKLHQFNHPAFGHPLIPRSFAPTSPSSASTTPSVKTPTFSTLPMEFLIDLLLSPVLFGIDNNGETGECEVPVEEENEKENEEKEEEERIRSKVMGKWGFGKRNENGKRQP